MKLNWGELKEAIWRPFRRVQISEFVKGEQRGLMRSLFYGHVNPPGRWWRADKSFADAFLPLRGNSRQMRRAWESRADADLCTSPEGLWGARSTRTDSALYLSRLLRCLRVCSNTHKHYITALSVFFLSRNHTVSVFGNRTLSVPSTYDNKPTFYIPLLNY